MQSTPIVKDLVLIGGGHSHVEVLKRFAMRPQPGVRLTLISREVHTPYSGMLPGLIAGHYTFDEAHIDLGPLARLGGARLYHDEVLALDLTARRVVCRHRPPVPYDIVSIDTGSVPDTSVAGAAEFAIPVKPVSNFNQRFEAAQARILAAAAPQCIGVVGGGAGGIELLLSIRHRLLHCLRTAGRAGDFLSFHLVSASDVLLPSHNPLVQSKFHRLLNALGVSLHLDARVTAVAADGITTTRGAIACDETFWVTSASAPAWPRSSGLAVDDDGFILVDACLRSSSHEDVFAAGDIAAMSDYPRPKSGVFAVRQGPPLSANLRRAVRGQALRPFIPQREFLSLISTGERHAIGSRGRLAIEGRWVWRVKDWIDRRFMRKYSDLPAMPAARPRIADDALAPALRELHSDPMRCGGCGSKVGADILAAALTQLHVHEHADVLIGLHEPDDAAVVVPHAGTVLVHTVDSFRTFIDDPYIFGRITANHCLGDIFAMGATPQSALALVTLPLASEAVMREDLVQLMAGALEVFNAENTALVGGHTNEGAELTLGFAVNGYIARERLSRKTGARAGDVLVLTKAIGSGVLLAAAMRGKAKTRDLEAAMAVMLQSNGAAATTLYEYGAHAVTDITGFGLFGHLHEMLRAATVGAAIALDNVPLFDGAAALAAAGIHSSLHDSNARIGAVIDVAEQTRSDARYALGFDPQTAGGLLASVPAERIDACLASLHRLGYASAAIIGSIDALDIAAAERRIRVS